MTTKRVRVDGLDVEYADTGTGPTILFVHGVYVAGAVWNDVVAELGDGFRCIVPTWPLGAHSTPTDGADLGAEAASQRTVHFMEALDLADVTVVANDTGGAWSWRRWAIRRLTRRRSPVWCSPIAIATNTFRQAPSCRS
jgi:pimeloyl-ACP methyl ester carboxylesterase